MARAAGLLLAALLISLVLQCVAYPYSIVSASQELSRWRRATLVVGGDVIEVTVMAPAEVWLAPRSYTVGTGLRLVEGGEPVDIVAELLLQLNGSVYGLGKWYVAHLEASVRNISTEIPVWVTPELFKVFKQYKERVFDAELLVRVYAYTAKDSRSTEMAPIDLRVVWRAPRDTVIIGRSDTVMGLGLIVGISVTANYSFYTAGLSGVRIELRGYSSTNLTALAELTVNGTSVSSVYIGRFRGPVLGSADIPLPRDAPLTPPVSVRVSLVAPEGVLSHLMNITVEPLRTVATPILRLGIPREVYAGVGTPVVVAVEVPRSAARGVALDTLVLAVGNSTTRVELGGRELEPGESFSVVEQVTFRSPGTALLNVTLEYRSGYPPVRGRVTRVLNVSVRPSVFIELNRSRVFVGEEVAVRVVTLTTGTLAIEAAPLVGNTSNTTLPLRWEKLLENRINRTVATLTLRAPEKPGRYMVRAVVNGVPSEPVELVVEGRVEASLVSSRVTAKPGGQAVLRIRVLPTASIVTEARLYKYEQGMGLWVLVPAAVKRSGNSTLELVFKAPSRPGTYKLKVTLLRGAKAVAELRGVELVVLSPSEKEGEEGAKSSKTAVAAPPTPAQGGAPGQSIPVELVVAVAAASTTASLVLWRRFRR